MRILHVVTAFPRTADDVITPWLVQLIKRLQAKGHEVEVLTSAYRGGGNAVFQGIPVHRFRYFPARWEDLTHDEAVPDRMKRAPRYRLAAVSYVACGMLAAWRLARRRHYDVVHVHWAMPHALFGWAARAACGARLVTTFYGVELRWTQKALGPLKRLLIRAARTSDRAVAISRHTAAEVYRLAGVETPVIPYGIGLPEETAGRAERAERAAEAFTVLFVGRLVERKGVNVLLDAVAAIRPRRDIRAVIVGDGSESERLEAHAKTLGLGQAVQFRGRVPARDLAHAYATANTCVLPAIVDSRGDTEGLGVVLLEAMSYGVPAIGSDIGGITDIIQDGETGLLVPSGDAQALAGAIERLANDPALAYRLGQAGARRVREEFTWEAIAAKWDAVYAGLATSSGHPRNRAPLVRG